MADKDENKDSGAPELTEQQRIEKLEKNLGTSRTIMMIVALLLVMVISVGVTAFIVFLGKDSSKNNNELNATIAALQTEITSLSAKLDEQTLRIEENASTVTELAKKIDKSSNSVILTLLLEQEASNQEVLDVARASIYDLAHMVPGSRTWLEVYSDRIDDAITYSKERQAKLKTLSSGGAVSAPPMEEDDGFGDF